MTDTGHYAIYRIEKISTPGSLAASSQHMARTRPTPNADPKRRDRNRVLVGSEDPEADVRALLPELGSRTDDGRLRRRANSVLAIEVLLTASPEWWQSSSAEQRREWLDRSVEYLAEAYGRENIAHLRLHQDERTPHLTGFIVPLDDGCLNARRWTGGRAALAAQQTAYAAALTDLGLRRGVEGSPAQHERVQRHYGALARPVAEIDVERPPRLLLDPAAWAARQAERARQAAAPAFARAAEAETARTAQKAAQAGQRAAQGRAERAEADAAKAKAEAKALADQMRELPLPAVLEALGFEQDRHDPLKWKADSFRISVGKGGREGKWFDHLADYGRGGAIDLVGHVMQTDFKGSLAWLAARFGPGAAAADLAAHLRASAEVQVREALAERGPFTPPTPAPENWPRVRRHLIDERALPPRYVDRLHELGDLYADSRRNAVFLCRNPSGAVTGAELKGTLTRDDGSRFGGMSPGSDKEAGAFRVGVGLAKAATLYLVESAIDAISLAKIRAEGGERDFVVASMAGTGSQLRPWLSALAASARRFVGYDNDSAGDRSAAKLAAEGFERLRPELHDWNDDLKAKSKGGGGGKPFDDPEASEPRDHPSPS